MCASVVVIHLCMCVRVVLPRMSAYARVRLRVRESERVYVCVRILARARRILARVRCVRVETDRNKMSESHKGVCKGAPCGVT